MAEHDNFWDDAEQKDIQPSASAVLKNVGDVVYGEIVDIFQTEYIPFGKTEPEKDSNGNPVMQRGIAIRTDARNWEKASKRPTKKTPDGQVVERPNEEDTGIRNVYFRKGTNSFFALGDALKAAGEKAGRKLAPEVGGTLGIKIVELRDTGKGNPLKVHGATYVPPAAPSGDTFFEAPAAQAAPAAPAAPAPSSDPWGAAPAAGSAPAPF